MSYPPEQQPQYPTQPQMPPVAPQAQQPGFPQGAPQGYPGQYAPQQGAPGQYPAQQGGYQAPPAAPRPNPFIGMPITDWIRDGAAVLLLLISLALPWRVSGGGDFGFGSIDLAAGRIDVLLITLVSVLSVGIGYMARAGVFGAMPATKAAMFRALANVPYILLVLVYVVFDVLKFGGYSMGAAAAVGLTGALFAALPRKYEVYTPEFSASAAKYGYFAALGLLAFAGITALLGIIFTCITYISIMGYGVDALTLVGAIVVSMLPVLAAVGLALWAVRRSEVARLIGVAAGVGALLGAFFAAMGQQASLPTVHSNFGYSMLVFSIGAAIYSTPGMPFAMRNPGPLNSWIAVLKTAPIVLIGGAALIVLGSVFSMIASRGQSIGYSIALLIAAVITIVGAVMMRMLVVSKLQQSRMIIAGIAGGLLLVGIIATIITGIGYGRTMIAFAMYDIMVVLVAPAALLVYALFVPKEMREFFPAMAPRQAQPQNQYGYGQGGAQPGVQPGAQSGYGQPAQAGYPQPGQPQAGQPAYGQPAYGQPAYGQPAQPGYAQPGQAQPGQAQPGYGQPAYGQPAAPETAQYTGAQPSVPAAPEVPVVPAAAAPAAAAVPPEAPAAAGMTEDAARAANPATPATELHAMSSRSELWPHLAANPSLYPELRSWLASTGDPAVLQALQNNPTQG